MWITSLAQMDYMLSLQDKLYGLDKDFSWFVPFSN